MYAGSPVDDRKTTRCFACSFVKHGGVLRKERGLVGGRQHHGTPRVVEHRDRAAGPERELRSGGRASTGGKFRDAASCGHRPAAGESSSVVLWTAELPLVGFSFSG